MAIWFILVLSVIIRALANEHTPNNPPYLLEELKATAESRVLERVENLLQTLSEKIKVLDDRIDGILIVQNETNAMFRTTNKSLGELSDKFDNLSTSTKQRLIYLEQKLEHLPEDTGVYFMKPNTSENITFEVSRDWTHNHGFGSNWIVFQRRFNGSVDFYRNWTEYKDGFGDLRGEHWLGLEKLHAIVKSRRHELLIVLEDFGGVIAYAHYDDFKIGGESEKYGLKSVGNYTGTAGDSLSYHKGCLFSTYDQDNDKAASNCAQSYVGAWWFCECYDGHLNGEYLNGKINRQAGIIWYRFRGLSNSLKSTKMMVRPIVRKLNKNET